MLHNMNLISLILSFILGVVCYQPPSRVANIQNLIGTKLYYAGGGHSKTYFNDMFYLDLSKSFRTDNPPWVSLDEASAPIYFLYSTSVVSPLDNSTIYLIGGFMRNLKDYNPDFSTTTFLFNSSNSKWSALNASGSVPIKRQEMQAVVDRKGKVFIFGGSVITNYTTFVGEDYNDLNILDITINTWTNIIPTSSSPNPRIDYTATLLENGVIVYIGGREFSLNGTNQTMFDLNQFKLFDTKTLSWTSMVTSGVNLQARIMHTAVLAKNGKIIVYGGESSIDSAVTPNLAVLDTSVSPYSWFVPAVTASPNDPPSLAGHSATIYGDFMIISFGVIVYEQGNVTDYNDNLYILDTTNYTWVNSFTATASTSTPENTTSTESDHKLVIGLSVAGGFIGLGIMGGLVYYLIKRKNKRSDILKIPGGSGDDKN